jgi:hypothetical protein
MKARLCPQVGVSNPRHGEAMAVVCALPRRQIHRFHFVPLLSGCSTSFSAGALYANQIGPRFLYFIVHSSISSHIGRNLGLMLVDSLCRLLNFTHLIVRYLSALFVLAVSHRRNA